MSRATSSLPVPESPEMCTGAWLRATLAIICRSCCIGRDWPSSLNAAGGTTGWVSSCGAPSSSRSFRVAAISLRSATRSSGLDRKSKAPSLSARTAVSTLPCAVITATGMPGRCCWIHCTMSRPLPSGRRMSVSTRSKLPAPRQRTAEAWSPAVSTSTCMRRSVSDSSSRMSGSSSMTSARGAGFRAAVFILSIDAGRRI